MKKIYLITFIISIFSFPSFCQTWTGSSVVTSTTDAGTFSQLTSTPWGGQHGLLFNAYKSSTLVNGPLSTVGNTKHSNDAAFTSGAGAIMFLANGGNMEFFISNQSAGTNQNVDWGIPKMIITRNGNVGIATTAPTERLMVQGNIQIPLSNSVGFIQSSDKFVHNGNNIGNYSLGWNTDSWQNGAPTGYLSAYGGLKIFTQSTPRLVVDYQGNVGVGTTTPSAKLDVNISLPTPASYDAQYWSTGNSLYSLRIQQVWDNNGISQRLVQKFNGVDYNVLSFLSGNVGIGTTAPDAKLAVKGQIHANEVKVDLLGSVAPDYVFEKSYALPTLEEVKIYIDQNKHLPEVPSAKEMEKNGVQLGEMNMLLLKKIEELTLYVIGLKKDNETLRREIKDWKAK